MEAEDVGPLSMGRSAAKVESIEEAVQDLELRAKSLSASGGNSYGSSGRTAGLSGSLCEDAGVTVGHTDHAAFSTFKEIESDRLAFVGVPSFDPSPFLDDHSRKVFQCPLECSRDPTDYHGPIPHVKIHCSRSEKIRLFELLDSSGRLSLHTADQIRGSYTSGMFSVVKSLDRDRLILDSRPPNMLEVPMQRWIRSLASAESLSQICLTADELLLCSGNDVRDYYHMFVATEQRKRRNALAGPLHPAELRHLSCYSDEFDKASKIYGALATLAMGDAQAVEIAQTCHVGMALQSGIASEENLINLSGFHPRSRNMVGIIIDDFISLSIVKRSSLGPSQGCVLASRMQDKYETEGLIPHKEKGFRDESDSSFWGMDISGDEGHLRGSLRRAIPLVGLLLRVAKLGFTSISLLEVLLGSIVSLFLLRRRFLSVIDYLYKACRGRKGSEIVKLSGKCISELLVCAALIPTAVVNLRAVQRARVVATDASNWGEAAVVAPAPAEFVSELHRFALRKAVWAKLLSPSQAWLRGHGLLSPEEELPDEEESFKMNPLWRIAAECLSYKVLFSEASEKHRHINISEIRALLRAERELGRKWPSSREIFGMDSQVGLGCLIKGRSSSTGINSLLSRSIGQMVIYDLYSAFMYLESSRNPADDPTRGAVLRSSSLSKPLWWDQLCTGNVQAFDEWAECHGIGYGAMTGLPHFSELLGPHEPKHEPETSSSFTLPSKESGLSVQADYSLSKDFCDETSPKTVVLQQPSAPGDDSVGASLGSAEEDPAPRECIDVVTSEEDLIHDKTKENGFCFKSKLGPLSPSELRRLYETFLKFDDAQILKKKGSCWPPTRPGFLDLYSGERGAARALHEISGEWVISFDIIYGARQDLNDPALRQDIEFLLEIGAVFGVGLAPVCRSFSVAVTPAIRCKDFPMGRPGVSERVQRSLDDGNQSSVWVFKLLRLCKRYDIRFWLENPALSWLFRIPSFLKLIDEFSGYADFWTADYCRYGKKWRKRTKFFTDTVLRGHKTLCAGCISHIKLRGRSSFHRKPWTVVAQPYPRGICKCLAFGLSLSAGVIEERPFDPSSCAKVGPLRIGEAKNPGPAPREPLILQEVPLVEAKTASLQSRVWKRFNSWVRENVSEEASESLLSNPQLLCLLLKEFGNVLYSEGAALYIYRHLAVYVQKTVYGSRPFMSVVWDNLHRWESLEPVTHRIPVPGSVVRAIIALAVHGSGLDLLGVLH